MVYTCTRGSMALRWGILSAGKISHDFVVGLKSLPETEHQVVAVAARSLESASKFAETHSIPRHYGSYQELANDTEVCVHYKSCSESQRKVSTNVHEGLIDSYGEAV